MTSPPPPPDDTEGLLASLDDLGARIEVARRSPGVAGTGGGRRRLRVVLGLGVLAVLLLVGGLALGGGDDGEGDVAVGDQAAQATTTTAASSTTAATTLASTTTASPTTMTTTTTIAPPADQPEPAPASPPADDPSFDTDGAEGTWTVASGESFWAIAERVTAEQLGRVATDAEVTPVWVDLLAANADRLVEPGNPNLILPGQVLVLPATAASP